MKFVARLLVVLTMLWASPSIAQDLLSSGPKPETEKVLPDPLGRDTPRGLMFGYLQAISSNDYERAGHYLTLPNSSESFKRARGTRLAEDLEVILDRAGVLNGNWSISDRPEGNVSDSLDRNTDEIGKIIIDGKKVPLLATRQKQEDGTLIWLIADSTVSRIPELIARSSRSLVDRAMPASIPNQEFFSVPYSHILFSAAALAALWMAMRALTGVAHFVVARMMRQSRRASLLLPLLDALKPPIAVLVSLALTLPALEASGVSVIMRGFLSPFIDIASVVFFTIAIVRAIDYAVDKFLVRAKDKGHASSLSIITLTRRGLKLAISFIALLAVLSAVGVDLTAGLAALGIGGIAIALGSQKAIEHFVGSITVVADDIVRIGDFCRFGTTLGEVEDIGIRSTRIRTLGRTLVTVPNGLFSSVEVENYTARDMYLFKHIVCLSPGTSHKQILYCLEEFREILAQDTSVDPDPARVRLISFDLAQPRIEVNAYVHAVDWNEFLGHQENLLLRILSSVERSGSEIAMPTQQNYDGKHVHAGEQAAPKRSDPSSPSQLPLFDAAQKS